MPHRRSRCGADWWRQRGGKDEPGSIRSECVHQIGTSSNVSAEAPESLGERAFDDINPMHRAITRHHPCSARAIHPDGVDLVAISQGVVALSDIAEAANRGDIAIHGVQAFEHDQLRSVWRGCSELAFQVDDIIVAPDL